LNEERLISLIEFVIEIFLHSLWLLFLICGAWLGGGLEAVGFRCFLEAALLAFFADARIQLVRTAPLFLRVKDINDVDRVRRARKTAAAILLGARERFSAFVARVDYCLELTQVAEGNLKNEGELQGRVRLI
jgi:hypothetical protein